MTRHADLATRLEYAAAWVRGKTDARPAVGVILGSGLGAWADRLVQRSSPTRRSASVSVAGHAGRMVVGDLRTGRRSPWRRCKRVHGYEGWPARRWPSAPGCSACSA
jgi:purine-nucleoside phosphorylase